MPTPLSISIEPMYSNEIFVKDEELVSLYVKERNGKAFEDLCKRYTALLYRYSMSFVRNRDDAEDIVQKTFIKVWKNIHTFDVSKKFSVWIYVIARRTALDEIKKKRAFSFSELSGEENTPFEETLESGLPSIERELQNLKNVNAFEEILKKMDEDKAEILFLKLYEDLTFEEIGELTERPMNTVKSIYRRSLLLVQKELVDTYHINAPKE